MTKKNLEAKFDKNLISENDETGVYYALFSHNGKEKASWEVTAYSFEEAKQKILFDKKCGRIPGVSRRKSYRIKAFLAYTVKSVVRFPEN